MILHRIQVNTVRNCTINVIDNHLVKVSCLIQYTTLCTDNKTSDDSVVPFVYTMYLYLSNLT
jgi:hypothetical protein